MSRRIAHDGSRRALDIGVISSYDDCCQASSGFSWAVLRCISLRDRLCAQEISEIVDADVKNATRAAAERAGTSPKSG